MNDKIYITAIFFIILAFPLTHGLGQSRDRITDARISPDFVAEKVADVATTRRGSNWLTFRQDARIAPQTIFNDHRDAFYLGNDDQMDIKRTEADDLGYTHYRYQQKYKGIKVEGAEMLVHAPRLFIGDNNDEA